MPTYRVDRPGMDLPRVVTAAQPSAARNHVADDELIVRRIEVDEAFELAQQGVTLERAGETPPEPAAEEQKPEPDADRLREDQQERSRLLAEEPDEEREPFDAGDEELEGN